MITERKGSVNKTQEGVIFAEVRVKSEKGFSASDLEEFGRIVYGPPRSTWKEAMKDERALSKAAAEGPGPLRRIVAKLAPLGGTKSHPNPGVRPMLAGKPEIEVGKPGEGKVRVRGVRRPGVTAFVGEDAPTLVLARVLDVLVDLLSCAYDSQLGLQPPAELLMEAVKYALSREGGQCPVAEKFVSPLIAEMLTAVPWNQLLPVRQRSDDAEVIGGLLRQCFDKARQVDRFGERKQVRRLRREVRNRRRLAHTVFVSNLPENVSQEQLFEVFNEGSNLVYKVTIPKPSYAFVVCRSAKATSHVLEKRDQYLLEGKKLYVAPREEEEGHSPKRQRTQASVPESVSAVIATIVKETPGCNVSVIPDLLQRATAQAFDPNKLGFLNLTQALQSIPTIRLERSAGPRPVYSAFPIGD